jgi:hypothetical protein
MRVSKSTLRGILRCARAPFGSPRFQRVTVAGVPVERVWPPQAAASLQVSLLPEARNAIADPGSKLRNHLPSPTPQIHPAQRKVSAK